MFNFKTVRFTTSNTKLIMAKALPYTLKQNCDASEDDFSGSDSDLSESLDQLFTEASDYVRKITSKLNNEQLLQLYGLYKQSTEGQCNTPKPSWLDGKGRKKWEAWRVLSDMSRQEAMRRYVELVKKLEPEFGLGSQGPKDYWAAVSSLQHLPEPDLVDDELTVFDAARENMGGLVAQLLATDPELKHASDDDGLTALHWAADRNATHALTALINAGCDINAIDNLFQTPLHYAASCDHVSSTQILVDAGARFIKDSEGCTPLDVATNAVVREILDSAKK